MAGADDVNSTLQGIVRNLGQLAQIANAPGYTLSTATSPKATIVTTLSTASMQVIAASTVRRAMTFFNSNPSGQNIWVVPANVSAVINQGIPIAAGSSYATPASVDNNAAWNAIAATGSTNVLTIIEFF